jgi:hypothetical protein
MRQQTEKDRIAKSLSFKFVRQLLDYHEHIIPPRPIKSA